MGMKRIRELAREKESKIYERVERSKLWQRFKPRADKILLMSTLGDVAANTAIVALGVYEPKWFAVLYPYAFVKDGLIRPLQGLSALATENERMKKYVAFYYLANVATAFTYPLLPVESYLPLLFLNGSKFKILRPKK